MQKKFLLSALLATLSSTTFAAEELDTVTVSADFRPENVDEVAGNVTVVDEIQQEQRGAEHMQDVLNTAPNVNFASGASRGNYVQIRGIGERSQFETPINPSVGLTIDGIDYSRTGSAGILFDTKQVEVLRGPQGTQYGSNAMAGMIVIKSNEPTAETEGFISQGVGNYNSRSNDFAVGGTLIEDKLLGRIALHSYQSDGYIKNEYLNRDDTQNQDELAGRGQLKWKINDDLTFDITALRIKTDNGYDAFNFDNNYTTESDTPGKDALNSTAYSLKSTWQMNPQVIMETILSKSNSGIEYSYDEDWTYQGKYDDSLWPYNSFDQYLRDRKNRTAEVRFLSSEQGRIFNNSTDWVLGAYRNLQDENMTRNQTDLDSGDTETTTSQFDTINTALYGQLDYHATARLTYSFGLRNEWYESQYDDSNGASSEVNENLLGGKLAAKYQISENHSSYALLSRGFKTGGINSNDEVPEENRNFETEYLWNIETGLNSSLLDNSLRTRLTAFYSWRENPQISSSLQLAEDEFVGYTSNVKEGYNYGIEAEFDWDINPKWRAMGSLGLLASGLSAHSYTDKYSLETYYMESGRNQAHAPNYQFSLGGEYYFAPNWTLAANVEGKDAFFFSDSHNQLSKAYELVNASLEYSRKNWVATLWVRNLFNREYDVRGFYFGNDPGTYYTPTLYTQKGEPRMFGLNVRYDF